MEERQKVAIPPFEIVQKERERYRKRKQNIRLLWNSLGVIVVVAAIAVLISTRFIPVLRITGSSMSPTLEEGEIVLFFNTSEVETGDIIGFYYQNKILVKRVIGVPGDYIEIEEDGKVLVNGQALNEPYITESALGDCDIEFPYWVQEEKYFVLGDNRAISTDSRSTWIGCVSEEQILGKAQFKIWPFENIE